MRLISTVVPTGALSEKVQVLEQIFAGQQTFCTILHIELLRCNTVNTNEIDLFAELHIGFVRLVSVDCKSLTPTQGATQQSVDCGSLTPTQGATQPSVDCKSLIPIQGATPQSVDWIIGPVSSIAPEG